MAADANFVCRQRTTRLTSGARALSIRSPSYRSIKSILVSGLDHQPLPGKPLQATLPLHENVRGSDYYH